MKSPHIQGITITSLVFALLFGIFTLPQTAVAQGTSGAVVNTTIPSGSLIIAMDNQRQGSANNCEGPLFNLKAYGLAVRLLHNNIPLRWAIDTDFTADDADLTVNANRYISATAPTQACTDADSANPKPFAGGPLIILQPNVAAALPIIDAFNAEIVDATPFNVGTGVQNRVRVYTTTAEVLNVPIRYTVTHKPFIAVGPDSSEGGNQFTQYRWRVHQRLYDYAKLASSNCTSVNTDTSLTNPDWGRCNNAGYTPYYQPVPNDLVTAASCYTIATQAHAENDATGNVTRYQDFAKSGGNLLFQCRSIGIFENVANGLFQTSSDWSLDTQGNGGNTYPNPWQPFKQFVGGLTAEFGTVGAFSGGTLGASFQQSVADSGGQYVASVGNIADFYDPNPPVGGHVFELGGHDYFRVGDDTPAPNQADMDIGHLNGQRMILNAVLVPAQRTGCALNIPVVGGRKQVVLATDLAPVGFISPGDVATWTIRYINIGGVPVTDFQITDALDGSQNPAGFGPAGTYVPGSLTIVNALNGSLAPINPNFNGVGDKNVLNPAAAAGARVLGVNGLITVTLQTTLTAYNTAYFNRPVATGVGIGPTQTDTVDSSQIGLLLGPHAETSCTGGDTESGPGAIAGRCYEQFEWVTGGFDPTGIRTTFGPTAAGVFVEGRVIQTGGRGLSNATIDLVDLSTGQHMLARTNSFGYFRFDDLEIGRVYTMTPSARRFTFPSGGYTFTMEDNLEGITFVGVSPLKAPEAKAAESVVTPEVPTRRVVRTVVTKSKSNR